MVKLNSSDSTATHILCEKRHGFCCISNDIELFIINFVTNPVNFEKEAIILNNILRFGTQLFLLIVIGIQFGILWPQIGVNILEHSKDEDPNYIFPEETSRYTVLGLAPVSLTIQVNMSKKDVKLMSIKE